MNETDLLDKIKAISKIYKNTSMSDVEKNLTGNVDRDEIYVVLCNMYKKHTKPLVQQGKKPMKLTPAHCKEHYTKHVVNSRQQVSDDILYCCKLQRHYKKNIGIKSSHSGQVTLNPNTTSALRRQLGIGILLMSCGYFYSFVFIGGDAKRLSSLYSRFGPNEKY